jgi:diguanylate cyclase (GGDEF)-like protein/PAS domain S-box-containing protein
MEARTKAKARLSNEMAKLGRRNERLEKSTSRLKKAVQELQRAEEAKKAILEALPDLMFRISREGVFLDYSAPKLDDLILPPHKFLGRKVTEVLSPELAQLIMDRIEQAAQTGHLQVFECPISQEGQTQYWEGRLTRCGKDQFLAICRNITDQRKSEESLRVSEEFNRRLAEESPVGILCLDRTGTITYENPTLARMLGVSEGTKSPGMGRNILELQTIQEAGAVPLIERALAGETIAGEIFEYRSLLGREVSLEAYSSPLKDKQGRPEGAIVTILNITGEKKADKIRHSIYKISEAAHSTRNLDELFHSIHRTIEDLMPAKNFYIALYDHDTGILSFPYFIDEYDEAPAPQKLGRGLTEYVLRLGEPLLVSPEVFEELEKKGEVESIGPPSIDWLGIPLKKEEETIGVLVVQSYTAGTRYGEEDRNILKFVSSQVAMAIQRKLTEDALRQSEERFRSLVQNSSDIITVLQADGTISYESPSIERILGYRPEDLVGKNIVEFVHPDDISRVQSLLWEEIQRPDLSVVGEFRFRHANGSWVYIESSGKNRLDDSVIQGVVINSRDITERKRAEETLRSLSLTDDLTGLYNRRGFMTLAEQQWKLAKRLNSRMLLLFADIDDLKTINDTRGHQEGDQALMETANLLKEAFRESDIIARVGGDEFVVLTMGAPEENVEVITTRLQTKLAARNAQGDLPFQLEISTGAACYDPENPYSIEEMLAQTDGLMYAQKRGKYGR